MKNVAGFAMIACGILFGLWAGLWWAFIGGIVDVISAIRSPELVAMDVAIGVAKVMFSGVIGYASAAVLVLPGYVVLNDA